MIDSYVYAFAKVIEAEGGLSLDPKDNGNWTGGREGIGELKGTHLGISASAYPDEDIKNLTLDRAKFLYKRDYWDKVEGDKLPDPLCHFVFDAAVNQGVVPAQRMLQTALKVKVDGNIGPKTLAAAKGMNHETCAVFMTLRAYRYMSTYRFDMYGEGWFKRLFMMTMGSAPK